MYVRLDVWVYDRVLCLDLTPVVRWVGARMPPGGALCGCCAGRRRGGGRAWFRGFPVLGWGGGAAFGRVHWPFPAPGFRGVGARPLLCCGLGVAVPAWCVPGGGRALVLWVPGAGIGRGARSVSLCVCV